MNIYLIGYRCTGKSTVGKHLADLLGIDFLDMDRFMEDTLGTTIASLVKREGWVFFRSLEKKTLMKTDFRSDTVIATGGGVVLDPNNVRFMKSHGSVVLLSALETVILDRLGKDINTLSLRPSLTGAGTAEETRALLQERTPIYKMAADFEVDTSFINPLEVAREIERRINYGRQ
ncbi:MAG: shikimate kinase [Pseudomonadota bacterium]